MKLESIKNVFILIIFISSIYEIQNFVALPFNTIYLKDKTSNEKNYFSNVTQSDLCVNFTIGSKNESIKAVLKMEKYGFIIYEKAYDYENSSSYETFDKDVQIRWIPRSTRFPSKDKLKLPHYESYKAFKEKRTYDLNMTNKTEFLRVEDIDEKDKHFFNEMYYTYGIIGLQLIANPYYTGMELVKLLKEINETKSTVFHLYFEDIKKNEFSTNDNKGYFLIGEELTDNKKYLKDIEYINCPEVDEYAKLMWGMNFSHIYLKQNESNIIEIDNITTSSEFVVNYPYIKGGIEYFEYINNIFFDELLSKNICKIVNFSRHDIYVRYESYGYACDSNSKYFMDKLNNNFPDLLFYNYDFNRNFTLTKKDLFAFNTLNESDTDLYFLVVNGIDENNRWILGIPFLKKYTLSFDYDNKRIGYYINYGKEEEEESDSDQKNNDEYNFFTSTAFIIIICVVSACIIFGLGMLFNNYLKKSRKKRANELDDDYEYENYENKINNDESRKSE